MAIETNARKEAPVDTGSLKSSITSQHRGRGLKTVVKVGPNVKSPEGAPYDVYQEFGTGIYQETWDGAKRPGLFIRPRRKRALAFNPRGQAGEYRRLTDLRTKTTKTTKFHGEGVVVKFVRGTPAVHYMKKGFDGTDIDGEFAIGFNKVRRKFT